MLLQDAIARAEQNITFNFRHPDYDRTIKLKKIYLQIVTGENIDDLLPQFELRENIDLWKQRKLLTLENMTPTISPICDRFYGVARIQPSKTLFVKDSTKAQYIEAVEKTLYNRQDVDCYMDNTLDEISIYDPNAFLAIGFESFEVGEVPQVYPTIFGCESVHDFVYKPNGILDFLFVAQDVEIRDKKVQGRVRSRKVQDYYCISEENAIVYRELTPDRVLVPQPSDREWVSENGRKYLVTEIFTGSEKLKTNEVPARRLGYISHKRYRKICVSPIHPAISLLKDMLRDKSELDVSKRCHVFPQKVMYDDVCQGEVHINPSRKCSGGMIVGTKNETCSVCGGNGFAPHKSGQEVIRIKRPLTKEEYIPIDSMITYVTTDLKALEMLIQEMERNAQKVERSIFSSTSTNQVSTSKNKEFKTATQAIISTDEYNYVLDAWAKNRAEWYMFIIRQIGQIFDTEVEVSYKYNGKYVMESQDDLITRFKSLSDAGVSEQILDEADLRIAKLMFDNDETSMQRYLTRRIFMPFRGRSKDEISTIIDSENIPKFTKVLYLNFGEIMESIEEEKGIEFYQLDRKVQREFIKIKVDEIITELKSEQPAQLLGIPRTLTPNSVQQQIPPAQ